MNVGGDDGYLFRSSGPFISKVYRQVVMPTQYNKILLFQYDHYLLKYWQRSNLCLLIKEPSWLAEPSGRDLRP